MAILPVSRLDEFIYGIAIWVRKNNKYCIILCTRRLSGLFNGLHKAFPFWSPKIP